MQPKDKDAESEQSFSDSADYQHQSDSKLMQQYAAGDLLAFETLYKRHKGGLYRYFKRHIPEVSLAEDLYQEIWNKVIVQAKRYQPSAKFTTWLYTLAHNKLVDHVRHLSVVNKVVVASQDAESFESHEDLQESHKDYEPEAKLVNTLIAESLQHCISLLPQAQKDSFLLKEEAGLSVSEIATVLNSSFEASKSRLRYAYENLRKCLHVKTGRAN
jgi:RNA polymerase sigma-70 factor (ECF subfamily)